METKGGYNSMIINWYPRTTEFEDKFRNPATVQSIVWNIVSFVKSSAQDCSVKCYLWNCFPILNTVRTYRIREYLLSDFAAGLTVGALMIPQGLAYAALSTLPPVIGLYMGFFATVSYIVFGTARHVSWGTSAVVSIMMSKLLEKYDNKIASSTMTGLCGETTYSEEFTTVNTQTSIASDGITTTESVSMDNSYFDPLTANRIEVVSSVSVTVGLIVMLASRLGLGRITVLLSDSLVSGFVVGVSYHIITSQIKHIFGLTLPRYSGVGELFVTWANVLTRLPQTHLPTFLLSLSCMVVIYLVKIFVNKKFKDRLSFPIPIELITVVVGIIVTIFARLDTDFQVKIVGNFPTGLPAMKVPNIGLGLDFIGDALVITVIAHAQNLAMCKSLAAKYNYEVDDNQELLASGISTVFCGFFSGFIPGASIARSMVQASAGGKTQIASIFAAAFVLCVIMFLGPYMYQLPICILASIIIVNLRTMLLEVLNIPEVWKKSRIDCCVWVFSFIAVIVLNADVGLLAAVIFSLCLIILRSMIDPVEETGQIQKSAHMVELRSLSNYSLATMLRNVKIIRVKTPLYYMNSDIFRMAVLKIVEKKNKQTDGHLPTVEDANEMHGVYHKFEEDDTDKVSANCDLPKGAHVQIASTMSSDDTKVVILNLSEMYFIDLMGIKALEMLVKETSSTDVMLVLTNAPEGILPMLKSTGFWDRHASRMFLNVEAALGTLAEVMLKID